jgi:penicillin-insensitive murein endopeptidase
MQRLALSLSLLLFCGAVSAEQAKPAKAPATAPAASADAAKKAAAATPEATKAVPANAAGAAQSAPVKKPAPKAPPAKELFGAVTAPAPLAARAIGSYAKGCLAGGISLPINGPDWQVMRLSRNRNWGHPRLLDYLERLASDARALDGWPGLLVGDMAQPRGGPMITGHASHQIGLDADIWLTPMPDRILTPQEREDISATSMLKDPFTVDPALWTPLHTKLIKRAASYPQVSRIFVHPAIKKILCEQAGKDRAWLAKVRPWWGHFYHFHIRLSCPPGAEGCENQKPVTGDDGCGTELANWYKMLRKAEVDAARTTTPGAAPVSRKPPMSLGDLPRECMTVLNSGGGMPAIAPDGTVPAALKAIAGKDAGPPAPHLDDAALAALKAQLSGSKGGAKPATDAAAKPDVPAGPATAAAAGSTPGAEDGPTSPADAVPLPDRKPH